MLALVAALHVSFGLQPAQALPEGGAASDGIVVHFIDVGQGDATLIQSGGANVLIDGGDRATAGALVRYLKEAGVSEIAYVVATHPHSDHIAGLVSVINEFRVAAVIMPRAAHTSVTFERFLDAIEKNGVPVIEPVPGKKLNAGGAVLTIAAPNGSGYRNLNNYSVSVLVTHGKTGFLFTGDAERESEAEIIANGIDVSAQVLHVGHHGSDTGTTRPFLDSVSPTIAVISVGKNNSYGHPSAEIVGRLEDSGVAVYRTDRDGTVVISGDGISLTVRR